MPRTEQAGTPAAFWRCGACGTPNPAAAYMVQCLGCGARRPARSVVEPPSGPAVAPRRGGRALAVLSWSYAVVVLVVLALVRWWSERWWPASVLLFAPRGVFLVPLAPMAVWAGWARRRLWLVHGATALVVAGPLMGFAVPWARLDPPAGDTRLRIMTFNRGVGRLKSRALIDLIDRERIDLICFQEGIADPVLEAYFQRGWQRDSRGFVATRLPIVAELDPTELPRDARGLWPVRIFGVRLKTPAGRDILLTDVHMPTMRFGFEALAGGDVAGFHHYIDWRWEQMRRLLDRLGAAGDLPVLIGGDFNMPSDSPMMSWLRPQFGFAFEDAGWGLGYTRPTTHPWVRIDHLLASPEWTFTRCRVGPDLGSDHLPLIAEVVLRDP